VQPTHTLAAHLPTQHPQPPLLVSAKHLGAEPALATFVDRPQQVFLQDGRANQPNDIPRLLLRGLARTRHGSIPAQPSEQPEHTQQFMTQ
jgi:hypothetical protein